LQRYGEHEVFSDNPNRQRKTVVSGRLDSMGKVCKLLKDDLATVFCMSIYLMDLLLSKQIENFPYSVLDLDRVSVINNILSGKRKRTFF